MRTRVISRILQQYRDGLDEVWPCPEWHMETEERFQIWLEHQCDETLLTVLDNQLCQLYR